MRFIKKGGEPSAFTEWKELNQRLSPQNLSYKNLQNPQKEIVKDSLLKEQGFVCGYTMSRLDSTKNLHIEHIESQSGNPEKDLDYSNMLACFPENGGDESHGYGAPIKKGKSVVLNVNFVSPHNPECEAHFIYDKDGGVSATSEAAKLTIQALKLDHQKLCDFRKQAAETHGLTLKVRSARTKREFKSVAEARRFAQEVMLPAVDGKLEPYCVALAQIALDFAHKEEQRCNSLRAS